MFKYPRRRPSRTSAGRILSSQLTRTSGSTSTCLPISPEVLSETELVIKQAVDASPGRVISRSELLQRCVGAGIKEATANQYLVYGPIAASPELNHWTTVGQDFDLGEADIQTVERKRTTECEWEGEDTVVLRSYLKGTSSVVVYFPVGFHPYVADKRFGAVDIAERDGREPSRSAENGQSWGYGPFLRRSGAEVGDLLVVTLSLDSGTAMLRLERAEAPAGTEGIEDDVSVPSDEQSIEPGPVTELTKTPQARRRCVGSGRTPRGLICRSSQLRDLARPKLSPNG